MEKASAEQQDTAVYLLSVLIRQLLCFRSCRLSGTKILTRNQNDPSRLDAR